MDDLGDVGEVGDGADDFEDPVLGAGAELEVFHGVAEHLLSGGIQRTELFHLAAAHAGIAGGFLPPANRSRWRGRARFTRSQCAYLLKGELGLLWAQADGRRAWAFMREWRAKAKASGIRQLQAMASTLLRHAKGILSYYKTHLTSGKMEGINRKIRGIFSSAFGFRDQDFFKLRLYSLHEFKFVG